MEIPSPSQSFLTVETVALLFLPLMMLFTVDWVTPLMVQSLFMERCRCSQSSRIRALTAPPIVIVILTILLEKG